MANRGPRTLAGQITLPGTATVDAATLRRALGISRQLLCAWRRRHGFPAHLAEGRESYVLTSDVANWLSARNVQVIYERR